MSEKRRKDRQLSLTDLAREAGVSRRTIQYYVMVGLIQEVDRTSGGHRRFDRQAVRRVKLIWKLNQSGYALRDIRETFLRRWVEE